MGEVTSTIYDFPWPRKTKEIACGIGLLWGPLCCYTEVYCIFAGQRACKALMLPCMHFILQSGILELEQIKHCIYNLEACETKASLTFHFHSDAFSKYCSILSFECLREQKSQISLHGFNINECSCALKLPSACRLM